MDGIRGVKGEDTVRRGSWGGVRRGEMLAIRRDTGNQGLISVIGFRWRWRFLRLLGSCDKGLANLRADSWGGGGGVPLFEGLEPLLVIVDSSNGLHLKSFLYPPQGTPLL